MECPNCKRDMIPKIAKPQPFSPFPNRKKPYCPKCGRYLPDMYKDVSIQVS